MNYRRGKIIYSEFGVDADTSAEKGIVTFLCLEIPIYIGTGARKKHFPLFVLIQKVEQKNQGERGNRR
jgi:hypothetical protein